MRRFIFLFLITPIFVYGNTDIDTEIPEMNFESASSQNSHIEEEIIVSETLKATTSIVSGALNTNTTWSPSDGIYILEKEFIVPKDIILTIEPGTIIKAKSGGSAVIKVYGTLHANGTAMEPIYFTSVADNSVGGNIESNDTSAPGPKDWQGIYFEEGSEGTLKHVSVLYAGYGGFGYGDYTALSNNGGRVIISNSAFMSGSLIGILQHKGSMDITESVIDGFSSIGVVMYGGELTASNTTLKRNGEMGLYARSGHFLSLVNNHFEQNLRTAQISTEIDFIHEGNTSSSDEYRGFEISGILKDGIHLHSRDLPLLVTQGLIQLERGSSAYIEKGTTIQLGRNSRIEIGGFLDVAGEEGSKVYFEPFVKNNNMDTPNSEKWHTIKFESGSVGRLRHAVIIGGGQSHAATGLSAAIHNIGGDIVFDNSIIENNFVIGLFQSSGTTTINHSIIRHQPIGLQITGGQLSIHESDVVDNDISGIDNTSDISINAQNNWWGSKDGPYHTIINPVGTGQVINGDILFSPWLEQDPAHKYKNNPVLVIPGIMGSYLNKTNLTINSEVWPNIQTMLLPGSDTYLDALRLSAEGESNADFPIKGTSIIKKIQNHDFFDSLIESLLLINGAQIFEYPYDWRLDNTINASGLNQNNPPSLSEKINEILESTGAKKVDIVAHSMGGLLVKKYIKDFGGERIDKFISIGTPHLGAPKAFKILNYGDNFGFEKFGFDILNPERVKIISQNMPAVYQLLPSKKYFQTTDQDYKYYIFNFLDQSNRLAYEQTNDYMVSLGRNENLINLATKFHDEIDDLNPQDYGVKTFNIVGCGIPTIGKIYILSKDGDHYTYNIKMINGDGTVPLKSAEAILSNHVYYVNNVQHAVLPSSSPVKEIIGQIFSNEPETIISGSHIDNCSMLNGLLVSFHSPVDLHIYDKKNNHAGPNQFGNIENSIPEIVYEIIEDNKFVFLPEGEDYIINGKATGEGILDIRFQSIFDGEVKTTTIFKDISITPTTGVAFILGSTTPSILSIDQDGDGVFESEKAVNIIHAGLLESDNVPVESSFKKDSSVKNRRKHFVLTTNVNNANNPEIVTTLDSQDAFLDKQIVRPNYDEGAANQKLINIEFSKNMPEKQLIHSVDSMNLASVNQSFNKLLLNNNLLNFLEWIKNKLDIVYEFFTFPITKLFLNALPV